jgi:hypothetical protein
LHALFAILHELRVPVHEELPERLLLELLLLPLPALVEHAVPHRDLGGAPVLVEQQDAAKPVERPEKMQRGGC